MPPSPQSTGCLPLTSSPTLTRVPAPGEATVTGVHRSPRRCAHAEGPLEPSRQGSPTSVLGPRLLPGSPPRSFPEPSFPGGKHRRPPDSFSHGMGVDPERLSKLRIWTASRKGPKKGAHPGGLGPRDPWDSGPTEVAGVGQPCRRHSGTQKAQAPPQLPPFLGHCEGVPHAQPLSSPNLQPTGLGAGVAGHKEAPRVASSLDRQRAGDSGLSESFLRVEQSSHGPDISA